MSRNRILIVDDEPGVRFGIRDFLELQGYEIEEAESCRDAQHIFRTSRPDIVIADYMLPDGTALDRPDAHNSTCKRGLAGGASAGPHRAALVHRSGGRAEWLDVAFRACPPPPLNDGL